MKEISPILLGVVSSLIATFVFLFIRQVYVGVFLPWVKSQLYRGVRVKGRWEDTNGHDKVGFILNLRQDADSISGTLIHQENRGGKLETLSYSINGYCRDGFLFALVTPVLGDAIDYQTLLLKIYHKNDTLYLKGDASYADGEDGHVETLQGIEFKKINR